jgi:hypothetical protein
MVQGMRISFLLVCLSFLDGTISFILPSSLPAVLGKGIARNLFQRSGESSVFSAMKFRAKEIRSSRSTLNWGTCSLNDDERANKKVIIVGAGVAGMSCAVTLAEKGIPFQILEASDGIGGRVRTDVVDGFLLDRGFQIFLTSYPEAQRLLDYRYLHLQCIMKSLA